MEMDTLIWILLILLFSFSFVGLIMPVIPGTVLIMIGFILYHFVIDATVLGWGFWMSMILFTLFSMVVDYVASGIFVKKYGGSKLSFWAAIGGVLAGPFMMGPIGLVAGPFLAVLIVELARKPDPEHALKVGLASVVGFLGGNLVRSLIHIVMIAWFMLIIL